MIETTAIGTCRMRKVYIIFDRSHNSVVEVWDSEAGAEARIIVLEEVRKSIGGYYWVEEVVHD